MFLRRLFKIGDKVRWLALELLVVFIGVYLAFLFQSYTEQRKIENEREKVLVSLKKEVEQFRVSFPLNAGGQQNDLRKWREALNKSEVVSYSGWRFLEPQYNFQVIEYAINLQGTETIDFELYTLLLKLYREIKQLEHAERIMTELAINFVVIPDDLARKSDTYKVLHAQSLFQFKKFIGFSGDRLSNLHEVTAIAEDVVDVINARLSIEKQQEIALGLLRDYWPTAEGDTTFLREIYDQHFSHLPEELFEEEMRKLLSEDQD